MDAIGGVGVCWFNTETVESRGTGQLDWDMWCLHSAQEPRQHEGAKGSNYNDKQ